MKHTSFDFDLSSFNPDEDYNYVKLAYETANSSSKKVLFVLDFMPKEDLQSGKLLTGVTGDLLNEIVGYTKRKYAKQTPSFSWLAVTFNAFKTYHRSQEYRYAAEKLFKERIEALIIKYKPDYVVPFGTSAMRSLLDDKLVADGKGRTRYSYWLGVPVEKVFKHGKVKHTAKVVSNFSLNDVVTGDAAEASMLGYMCRCLLPIFGKGYSISTNVMSKGVRVVDTMDKFDKLMDVIAKKPCVAIDTEAKNLHKITNRLLTVQFAYNEDVAFILPVSHKDSPFTPKEVTRIKARLKAFFEGDNENEYHIYTNAKFDLTLFRSECGVEYFKNDVWDILGGEFVLDESMGSMDTMIGEYYYSLGNLAVQYGFEGYLNAEFGKQHRADFSSTDLTDENVLKYCGWDVTVPFAIHNVQKQRAKDDGYVHYEKVVRHEISDTIHSFSKMEHTGAGLDVNYLFYLRTDKSPIEGVIRNMQEDLLGTSAVLSANKLIAKDSGMPTTSLWGDAYQAASAFKLNKPAHRKLLFFKILGLEPLGKGKSGEGKLDKAFQQHYAHIPEVAKYTALEKAKKLKNAYVKSFITMLGENEDLQKDHRIRPDYGYLTVVTHRTSARNPNLQQVPAHSELGKHIKRLFCSRPGTLYIKVDYRVHEVRGWGIISSDKNVAGVFADAKKLRDEYRLHPTKELAKRIKTEADVHIQNAAYFFQKKMHEVDKPLRNAVKGIIFGFIYGMGLKTMAGNIKQEVDFTKKLLENFAKRFPKAVAWSKGVKEFAKDNLYVEAPTRIRRHLWGYLLPRSIQHADSVAARNDRQAGNAPIQGMSSKFMMNGIRVLDELIFKESLKKLKHGFELYITNSVHDSLENEAAYANFLRSLAMIEWSLTTGVSQVVSRRHGFKLISDLEIDFEIGASLSQTEGWDFSVHQLDRLVMDSLLFQRNKLGHKVNPDQAYSVVFSARALRDDAPNWMKSQIQNLGYEFALTEKSYIREILDSGRAKIAEGKTLAEGDEESVKKSKAVISEGEDLVAYARELNEARKCFSTS